MTIPNQTPNINRRAAIAGGIAVAAAPVAAQPQDPLIEMVAEWERYYSAAFAVAEDDDAFDAALIRADLIARRICNTRAKTREGLAAQIRFFAEDPGKAVRELSPNFYPVVGHMAEAAGELV